MIDVKIDLEIKYPPSEPCTCERCVGFCSRPGWWTPQQAAKAIDSGLASRMMLEISPHLRFGVLSPAFLGCEGGFALQVYSMNGCNFLKNDRCELYGTPFEPLECRFCHHDRPGGGFRCHRDIEDEWNSFEGEEIVDMWIEKTEFPFSDFYNGIIRGRII